MSGLLVAVVGAESTGKTTLARDLTEALLGLGHDAVMVSETLRGFCDDHQRTPRCDEQAQIAATHTDRIRQSLASHAVVVADTTSLMTAVYSELIFNDTSLHAQALADQGLAALTLLTSLDLPWVADGWQRDGPQVRLPVDQALRRALIGQCLPFSVVSGVGDARLAQALAVVMHRLEAPARSQRQAEGPRWRWACERCDDGDCEQHWLPRPTPQA